MTRARDVYVAIMVAADRGTGLRLSWAECAALSLDDAIATRAGNALTEAEHDAIFTGGWTDIDPYAKRQGANLSGYSTDDPEMPPA